MPNFSVLVLTAAPPGASAEAAGALVKIDGREVLLRSVELFLNRDNVKQIQLVVSQEGAEEAKRKFGGHLSFSGVKLLVGGLRWVDQMAAAAEKIAPECDYVLIHDAARPAVPYSDIEAIMEAAAKHPAVALTSVLRTTLVEVDEGGNAIGYCPPDRYQNLLTPQVFSKAKFLEFARARREPHPSELTLLKGWPLNLRVGHGGDASLIKAIFNLMPKPKLRPPSSPFEEAQW